ncbi:RNA methyltransferase [Halorubrum saccharovorum]|uniref:RNA methyltransferase n=1 Tax=Halorubrum saccharovorum TaxID=2248 RepID=A0A081EUH1_9EURY|nr:MULTISPECIES: TrmJ/YjtD family RNA methyltransferase [Halorubrum]KDS91059.1 RNA methyltransferase [Halorubrum saccharovorum]
MSGGDEGDGDGHESPQPRRKPVVVVVEPETPGNVGTIARAMKNFGLTDLKLVDPPELKEDGEAYGFAGHAREDVLPNADEVTFDEVVANYHTVGTTAITGEDDQSHERFPFKTPVELRESLETVDAPTAIVFGREGRGLNNEELSRLDEVCSIPAADDYPVLNLGQAATVLLYELRDLTVDETQLPDTAVTRAPEGDVERFHEFFGEFLESTGQREHVREKNALLMRRLLGRAHPTEREIHSLLGTFRKANTKLEHADHLAAKHDEPVYPRE